MWENSRKQKLYIIVSSECELFEMKGGSAAGTQGTRRSVMHDAAGEPAAGARPIYLYWSGQ